MSAVTLIGALLVPALIVLVVVHALVKGVDVYQAFIDGAKRALPTVGRVLPYIAAITIAVGIFRASGALDAVLGVVAPPFEALGIPREVLPLELLRPFSGSASNALLQDVFVQYGPDSDVGRLASVLMGSSETLFYTVALYFGSIGVTKVRHTISASLIAEFFSVILIVNFVKYFF